MQMKDVGGIMTLNNSAWQIFLYSDNKREMKTALTWVNKALTLDPKPSPGMMDTKACLLYKLGKKKAAIELETRADEIQREQDKEMADSYRKTVEGMKLGKKIWLDHRADAGPF